jgi:oligopeptide/dipeptide ABC transporter ATP-binding protein
MPNTLLKVEGLKKYFPIKSGVFKQTKQYLRAVDDVSFEVNEQETFALVGESGCGKSTTGRSILRILEPSDGQVMFNGENILEYSNDKMRKMRKDMQLIFQDPYSSLNPRMTVKQLVLEPLQTHYSYHRKEAEEKVNDILEKVGLSKEHRDRYPHQFSGGQRQRISIARALVLQPKLVIADEPVSALDVSIQSQILNLLMELQDEFKLTYLFISHDLNVVRHVSDRVGVMYLGKLVEMATTKKLYEEPLHPYTQALLSAVPVRDPLEKKERIILRGDVPSPINPPPGCPFHQRCPKAEDVCKTKKPIYKKVGSDHWVACHLY